jgi:natural product biosynthesis luciferase-like monooxygenase protein
VSPATIPELLSALLQTSPDLEIYSFLSPDGACREKFTLRVLDQTVRSAAKDLRKRSSFGDRVLVVYYPGLDFIVNFLACIYAGVVAVPIPPPSNNRNRKRLEEIASNAGATIVAGAQDNHRLFFERILTGNSEAGSDLYAKVADSEDRLPTIEAETLAFLQYTSGSTASPKGVMLSHRNLICNLQQMHETFCLTHRDRALFWLPLFHDMGLIGGVLQPLFSGYPVAFYAAESFMANPTGWLDLLSQQRSTISGGPNFAYDLTVHALRTEPDPKLDLSAWRIAFNGAERVRAKTLRSFTDAYKRFGFKASAFRPCFGMAEATLLVASETYSEDTVLRVSAEEISNGKVSRSTDRDATSLNFVSVGKVAPGISATIVDFNNGIEKTEGQIGEIWIAGPNIANGYWNGGGEEQKVFGLRLPNNKNDYLRSGDLGFIYLTNLYVTGRIKDTIVIRGFNYYPDDIEATVMTSHQAVRPGSTVAIAVEDGKEEQLVVIQELSRKTSLATLSEVENAIRLSVSTEHSTAPSKVLLVRRGALPRTSSGKISRSACRLGYSFDQFASSLIPRADRRGKSSQDTGLERTSVDPSRVEQEILIFLKRQLHLESEEIDHDSQLGSLGLDSLQLSQLKICVEKLTGRSISLLSLLDSKVKDLHRLVGEELREESPSSTLYQTIFSKSKAFPLSEGQSSLWFDHKLMPNGASRTVSRLIKITGPLDITKLVQVINRLPLKHPILSARFDEADGIPYQEIQTTIQPIVAQYDSSTWSEASLREAISNDKKSTFSLGSGPLLRFSLFQRSNESHYLLFNSHHLIVDLWSFILLAKDILNAYRTSVTDLTAAGSGVGYADFVDWQQNLLTSSEGTRLRQFWRTRLADPPPRLELAHAVRNERLRTTGHHKFFVNEKLTRALKVFSKKQGTTLHTVLLSCIQIALAHYSGQHCFLIGLLTSGRDNSKWHEVVGYFINPIILRAEIDINATYVENLRRCREELTSATEHAAYPFRNVIADANKESEKKRLPSVNIMCMLQPSVMSGFDNLGRAVMGVSDELFQCENISLESVEEEIREDQFELTVKAVDVNNIVHCSFDYDLICLSQETISDLADLLLSVLQGAVSEPNSLLSHFSCFHGTARTSSENSVVAPKTSPVACGTIHELFEEQTRINPKGTALIQRSSELTFLATNGKANRLANLLVANGVLIEDKVAIYVERSADMVVAILGVLKAGAAYVPIDLTSPAERLTHTLNEAGVSVVVTTMSLLATILPSTGRRLICVDDESIFAGFDGVSGPEVKVESDNLAYVMYTSGSTGKPKGVMISHRNVINLFNGLDEKIGCGPKDTLLAVTSIAFDISVLELMWTLSRGCRVVIGESTHLDPVARRSSSPSSNRALNFSLFYFAAAKSKLQTDPYKLLVEGAKAADRYGFDAIWTPERHFDAFGGQYPNPALTSAALAFITRRIHLRGGSVVLPLNNPIKVAEQWAAVDSMSNGRVGVAFAPGWHVNDFVLAPENYAERRQIMMDGIDLVRRLWEGDEVSVRSISGDLIKIRTFPRPVQSQLPIWLTSGGSAHTFSLAATTGANVLTHLLGQDLSELAQLIKLYKEGRSQQNADPSSSKITMMLHTYIDDSEKKVREKALSPFKEYLSSSIDLIGKFLASEKADIDLSRLSESEKNDLLDFAAERYFKTSGLLGTRASCLERLDHLAAIGVNEVACLVDFGVDERSVLESIDKLNGLQESINRPAVPIFKDSPWSEALHHHVTMMQCTPSFLRMGEGNPSTIKLLSSLNKLLLGGESIPPILVRNAHEAGVLQVFNMYGPTETTVWSTVTEVHGENASNIGGPIVNTQVHILDEEFGPISMLDIVGEIFISGEGIARGYLGDPSLTASRFIPDPFSSTPGCRMYRTGDLGRWHSDGRIEIVGRNDHQVKVRGNRVDLGEIETILNRVSTISTSIVIQETGYLEPRLTAYILPIAPNIDISKVREQLRKKLPSYMIPDRFEIISQFPLTTNGKIDRKAIQPSRLSERESEAQSPKFSDDHSESLESTIASIWQQVLGREDIPKNESFFDLGGHSLLMVQLHQKLEKAFKLEFPLITLLEHPTIHSFYEWMAGHDSNLSKANGSQRIEKQRDSLLSRRPRKNN